MKFLMLLLVIVLSSCSSIDTEFTKAISFGEIVDLNDYSINVEKSLFVRLYRSPVYKENCFIETHGVCKYQYFISVSTFDEYPDVAIYKLSEQGEIKEINWSGSSQIDTAIIEFTMNSFTEMALKNNSSLIPESKKLLVMVNPTSIKQSLTKQSTGLR
ncbi:hypothetical protein [Aliikangiella maris]|uniref:Uncharacterized protein n=2 Tax=Aliikangiella maris TaxID=3162458 RepID=A0ABV2BYP7_9GAMM